MTETGFSSWVTTQGPLMHARHAALAHAFMKSTLTPEQLTLRDWRKQGGSDDRPIVRAAHGEPPRIRIDEIRGRAETRESFASRIAARRRENAEAAYAD